MLLKEETYAEALFKTNLCNFIFIDGVSKNYTVTFDENLGNVSLLEEVNGFVNATIGMISEASGLGTKTQILIDGKPTSLFDAQQDSAATVESAIATSFGIRCPNSIQINERADSFATLDYEGCSWGDGMVNETAFCGKCSSTNTRTFFSNLNVSLSYEYVSERGKVLRLTVTC